MSTHVGDISPSACALHSWARRGLERAELILPCDGGGRFTLLTQALGSLKSKPLGKCQHLLSPGGFPCSGGGVLQETSPSSEFKGSPGRGEVRTLNQHFKLVLSTWHQEELVQAAGTRDMCARFQQPESGPCPGPFFPGEHRRQRAGRLRRDGCGLVSGPHAEKLLSRLGYCPVDLRGVLGTFYCDLCPPRVSGVHLCLGWGVAGRVTHCQCKQVAWRAGPGSGLLASPPGGQALCSEHRAPCSPSCEGGGSTLGASLLAQVGHTD